MKEPAAIELIEVLDSKLQPLKDLSLVRPTYPPKDKVSDPWFPERVLIPKALQDSFRVLFPAETKHEGTEAVVTDLIGQRHVIALYGAPPALRDLPEVVAARELLAADEETLRLAKLRKTPPLTAEEKLLEKSIADRKLALAAKAKLPLASTTAVRPGFTGVPTAFPSQHGPSNPSGAVTLPPVPGKAVTLGGV